MAPSVVTRTAKAQAKSGSRASRASQRHHEARLAYDAIEESATQANQVEDEEIAEEIMNTTSKLEELKNPDSGLDQQSRSFLKTLTADKDRVTVKLDEARAVNDKDKEGHEEMLLKLLGTALKPVVSGAAPIVHSKPIHLTQVTAQGQPLHQQSLLLLEESQALLETYKGLLGQPGASPLNKLVEDFDRTRDYTENLFAAGRKVGKSEIENMLADKYNEVRGRCLVSDDEQAMGRLVFAEADGREDDVVVADAEGWGRVAYKAARAAHRMEGVTRRQ